MDFTLWFAPGLDEEVARIHAYRENESIGSGESFVKALLECYALIRSNPFRFPLVKSPYRHAPLRRLKYRVVFEVQDEIVLIFQVRHTSRKPSKRFGP